MLPPPLVTLQAGVVGTTFIYASRPVAVNDTMLWGVTCGFAGAMAMLTSGPGFTITDANALTPPEVARTVAL